MESVEKFLQMEQEKAWNQKMYKGYSYWTYNRYTIFNQIDIRVNERVQLTFSSKFTFSERCKRYFQAIFQKQFRLYKVLKKSNVLIFNHPRRVKNQELYECVYTDILAQNLDDVQVLESSYQNKHFEPTATKNLVYLDRLELWCEWRYYFYRIFRMWEYKKDKEEFCTISHEIASDIKDYFSVSVPEERIYNVLFHGYCTYQFSYKMLERILKKVQPAVIIECASYCTPIVMMANEMAKKRNIITIELQHGSMGRNHIGYNYLEKGIFQFPDKIFTYSQYWNQITRIPLEEKNIVSCGFPYFEKNIKRFNEQSKAEKKQVIFVSQTVIGKILSKFAVDLWSEVKEKCDYKFVYKLHPGEYAGWKDRYPWLAKSGIQVIDDNERGIYELFSESTVQVGVYSTAIYEGLGFGLETFLVKTYRSEDMEDLCKEGYAVMVEKPEDVVPYLLMEKRDIKPKDVKSFWKNDSLNNILSEIKKIIN